MTHREHEIFGARNLGIGAKLQDVADLRVNYAEHPDEVELLEEQEEIEWRLGVDYFERRDAK